MSLRLRLALTLGVVVAVAVSLVATAAYVLTARQLRSEIDDFLIGQAALTLGGPLDRFDRFERLPGLAGLRGSDAVFQLLSHDGDIVVQVEGEVELPVDDTDRQIAAGGAGSRLRRVEVDGVAIRVLTAGRPQGALQVGRELTETDRVLRDLRSRLLLVGLSGTAAAAFIGWGLAAGLSRPIRRLTRAAEHVAVTQDLDAAIPVEGTGEVASLAVSFNTMLTALETSREQQRRLIMDASHELRTPLTSLRTNVDLLRRAAALPPQDREALLADLDREVGELTDLTGELVELATTTRAADEPFEPIALAELAADVARRAGRRGGRTVAVVLDQPAEVPGRPASLERALTNLVDNALKFSPAGTPVTISVTGTRLAVADGGPGVAPEDRDWIFDRFYRSALTRDAPGSGLGLAIVADIVAAHGGRTFVEDNPGGGAVVGFSLPGGRTPGAPPGC